MKVAGLKKLVPGEQRDPYSADQLIKIIKSPLYTGHKSEGCRHKPGTLVTRDGYFWTPLIALFSGMRLGEILQLQKPDVKQENGIWYFDVSKGGAFNHWVCYKGKYGIVCPAPFPGAPQDMHS